MKLERGLIHLYTGEGKGNHSSHGTGPACGRIGEKGADCAVHEGQGYGELHSLARIPEIRLLRSEKDSGFFSYDPGTEGGADRNS